AHAGLPFASVPVQGRSVRRAPDNSCEKFSRRLSGRRDLRKNAARRGNSIALRHSGAPEGRTTVRTCAPENLEIPDRRSAPSGMTAFELLRRACETAATSFLLRGIAVHRIDPQDGLRLFHRLDVDIDRDRLALAAPPHALPH